MADLLRVEPSKYCQGEAWFVYDDGRSYLRKIDAQEASGGAGPMIISDHIDACVSHADGKTYESKSALFRSYRPDGNPQGVRYECIGEKVAEPFKRLKASKQQRHEATRYALDRMGI